VDLSDDRPSPRRPLFLPVVIATVFLSVIGLSAGLVLGSRHQDTDTSTPGTPQAGRLPDVAATTPPTSAPTTPAPSATVKGSPCRAETQAAAAGQGVAGPLTVVLYLRTTSSAVWICLAGDGGMYYSANNTGPDGQWIEGQTALFLPNVVRGDDDYHVTAADGTVFSVNRLRLFIRHQNGTTETQTATR
jgi:hypothetical protein